MGIFGKKREIPEKKNSMIDVNNPDNTDEIIHRSKLSVSAVIRILQEMKVTINEIEKYDVEERKRFYIDLNANVDILNKYVKNLRILALSLVNGKYKEKPKGSYWNLNFLSQLNKITGSFPKFGTISDKEIETYVNKYLEIFSNIKL